MFIKNHITILAIIMFMFFSACAPQNKLTSESSQNNLASTASHDSESDDSEKHVKSITSPQQKLTSEKEILDSKDVSEFAKGHYAVLRAMGCSFEEILQIYETDSNGILPADINSGFSCDNDGIAFCTEIQCDETKADDSLLKEQIKSQRSNINNLLTWSIPRGFDCFAAGEGDIRFFDVLIKAGVDITKPDDNGVTVLMVTENVAIAKKFIESGGDVNAKSSKNMTALDLQTLKLDMMNMSCEEDEEDCSGYFYQESIMGEEDDGRTCADRVRDDIREIISIIKTASVH